MTIAKVIKQGTSIVIVLPRIFRDYYDIDEGDFLNISDIYKVDKNGMRKKGTGE